MGRVMESGPNGEPGVCIDLARIFLRARGYISAGGGKSDVAVMAERPVGEGPSSVVDELMQMDDLMRAIELNLTPALTPHEMAMAWIKNECMKANAK